MAKTTNRLIRCFELCHQRAWRMAVALVHDRHAAFDVVQQAWLVASAKPGRVPADDPWPWFARVVLLEARNYRRKKHPATGISLEFAMNDTQDPARQAADTESRQVLRSAVDALPAHEREAVLLTHISGMTHAQAATVLGLPVKTVSTHVARGLERLRGRVGSRAGEMLAGVAAAPLAEPPGGWEAALAIWKSAALSGSGPVAMAVTTGVIMAKQTMIVASLALALGLAGGAALHYVWQQPVEKLPLTLVSPPDSVREGHEQSPARESDAAVQLDARVRRELAEALGRAESLQRERDSALAAKTSAESALAELRQQVSTLTSELEPYRIEAAERGPVFRFGKYGSIEGVTQSNWKELSKASSVVAACIREIRACQREGKPVPSAVQIRLQEHTELVRRYEYKTLKILPSAAKHNGELTHPISHANLVAGELKLAGLPLSDDQVRRIEALGLSFEADFEAAQRRYNANSPRCEKLLDELLLKGAFVDAVWDVLSAEQRAIFVTPETLHIAGTDLYCPTLMLVHTSPIVAGADAAEVTSKLRGILVAKFKISAEHESALDVLLQHWQGEVAGILAAVPKHAVSRYTYDQAVVALMAHVKLTKGMRDTCGLDSEARAALLDAYEVYIPRVVEG